MKERTIYMILFVTIIFSFSILDLSAINPEADASIQIRQETVTKFLTAVGDLSNTEKFSVVGLSGSYRWLVQNPNIIFSPGKALFTADVTITINPDNITTKSQANGEVSVRYDNETNKISIRVTKAIVEIKAKILGNMIKIAEIDLAKYYTIAFDFPGPKPFESVVDVKMPDGKIKKLSIVTNPVLSIAEGAIVVGTSMQYKPIP